MTDAITLAHLSDVHLGPLQGFSARHWNLKRGLGYLNWQYGRKSVHQGEVLARLVADMMAHAPDHIAVTGDLVNLGLPAEYDAALAWLERLGSPADVTVVPGNHDIYVSLKRDPGVKRWAAYMQPCAWGRQWQGAHEAFPFMRRVGPVALIGLNSAVPTPPFVAAGRLGRPQLDGLGAALDRALAAGLVRVVLIHHPPLPGQAPPRRGLADARELAQVLAAHGAELVLHGHNHTDTLVWQPTSRGNMLVAGVASGSAGRHHGSDPLARYNLIRIARDGASASIELHARGLREPGGPVVDIERRVMGSVVENIKK